MNIPQGLDKDQTRALLQRQIAMGRYMILATVIVSLIDIVLLLCGEDFYITYNAALAYYPVWLGMGMDNHFSAVWSRIDVYTWTGLVLGAVVLVVCLTMWLLSKNSRGWFKAAMVLLAVDLAALVAFILLLRQELVMYIWELVIHIAVLWEMKKALDAYRQLQQLAEAETVNT